jgi:hypothetical protein
MQSATQQPSTVGQYKQNYEYYHMGDLMGYQVGPSQSYTYVALDITAAYNNHWSAVPYSSANLWAANTANSSNRSYRCQGCTRSFTFIPSKNGLTGNGTAAYLVVYDDIIATNANFVKKDIVHFINQPAIAGNAFSWQRAENITSLPGSFASHYLGMLAFASGSNGVNYQYSAQGYGWCLLPASCNLTLIGGPGREFEITDANGPVNHNACGRYGSSDSVQCTSLSGGITGIAAEGSGFVIPVGNRNLLISVDGGADQPVTLNSGVTTAASVVSQINAAITGATATVEGQDPAAPANTQGRVAITSNSTTGGSSSITLKATANSAYAVLGMTRFVGVSSTGAADFGMDARGGGLVGNPDYVHPIAATSPRETGSWRIEETELPVNNTATAYTSGTPNQETWFLNLYRLTSVGDTNLVSTAPAAVSRTAGAAACPANGSDCWELTWKDNGNTCSYTLTLAKRGAGGILTAAGAGCKAAI